MRAQCRLAWLSCLLCVSAAVLHAQHGGSHSGSPGSYASGIGRSAISPYHSPPSIGLSVPSVGLSRPSFGSSSSTFTGDRFRRQYPSFGGFSRTNSGNYVNGPWRRGSRNGRYAYALPFGYFGFPYYSSFDGTGAAASADYGNYSDGSGLADQVQQLSAKIDQLQNQLSQQSADGPAPQITEQTAPTPPITVVLNDGRTLEVQNYAVVGNVFWDFSDQPARKIPISTINVAASAKASETNGAEFPQIAASR